MIAKRKVQGFCRPGPEHAKNGRKGGLCGSGGVSNVLLNADLKLGIFAPGAQASAARLMLHQRWHVQRKRKNPACWLCRTSTKVPPKLA